MLYLQVPALPTGILSFMEELGCDTMGTESSVGGEVCRPCDCICLHTTPQRGAAAISGSPHFSALGTVWMCMAEH